MAQDLIVLSSITYAYKAQRLLEQAWIKCVVVRTPERLSDKGCSYSLAVSSDLDRALELLARNGIRVVKILHG